MAIIFLAALLPSVQAIPSQIVINTESFHDLIVRVVSGPDSDVVVNTVYGKTNSSGQAVINYSTPNDRLSFLVLVRLFGETVITKRFNNIQVSNSMLLNFKNETTQENAEDQQDDPSSNQSSNGNVDVNVSLNSTANDSNANTETAKTNKEKSNKITGFFVSEQTGGPTKKVYYSIIAIFAITVSIILLKRRYKNKELYGVQPPQVIDNPRPKFGLTLFKKSEQPKTMSDELLDAERKIKEAEEEIRKIKAKNAQLLIAEKEYLQARKRYEELKRQNDKDEFDIKRLKDATL